MLSPVLFEFSDHVHAFIAKVEMLIETVVHGGLEESSSAEAARTRSVAKRSLEEGGVAARYVATGIVTEWQGLWS